VPEPQPETGELDAGHLGIELPGVEVHDVVSITRDRAPHESAEESSRVKTEVAPSRDRKLEAPEPFHGERQLGDVPVRGVDARAERRAEVVEPGVPIVERERMKAGIIPVAALGQDREVFVIDAEGRCAIANDLFAGEGLEDFPCADDIVLEFRLVSCVGRT